MSEGEYRRRKSELQAQLDALRTPKTPEVEQAGETLGQEWTSAPKKHKRDMLRCIFEAILVDVEEEKLVAVKPYPPFVPLFRTAGLEEKEDGCFYLAEEET